MRYYGTFEHKADLEYDIILDKNNKYYTTFCNSDVEGTIVHFKTDHQGYIYPSKVHADPDYKMFFLGDSSVECTFVAPEKRFVYKVGRILEWGGIQKINSYNAGISGADTLSMIKVLINKIFMERPDVVVLCNLKSELKALLSSGNARWIGASMEKNAVFDSEDMYRAPFLRRCKTAAGLVLPFLKRRYVSVPAETISDADKPICRDKVLNIIAENYRCFIKLCKCRDIKVILMTQANAYSASEERIRSLYMQREQSETRVDYEGYIELYQQGNQLIRDICKEEKVKCIDLALKVSADMLYDEVHYTNFGSEKVAEMIAKDLRFIL